MEKSVLMSVVFPRPDSPYRKHIRISGQQNVEAIIVPTTIIVKWAPRFATILCLYITIKSKLLTSGFRGQREGKDVYVLAAYTIRT